MLHEAEKKAQLESGGGAWAGHGAAWARASTPRAGVMGPTPAPLSPPGLRPLLLSQERPTPPLLLLLLVRTLPASKNTWGETLLSGPPQTSDLWSYERQSFTEQSRHAHNSATGTAPCRGRCPLRAPEAHKVPVWSPTRRLTLNNCGSHFWV